jgi:Predicted membrane protein (DUF2142)
MRHRRGNADEVVTCVPERPARPFRSVWLVSWVAFFAMGALWSIANPLGNSPDEPAQIARAVALYRGQIIGTPVAHKAPAYTEIRVPRTYALALNGAQNAVDGHDCYHFLPTVPASCERVVVSDRLVSTTTYFGRYPPLYYLLVGLPSVATSDKDGLYLMRLLSVAWGTLFLALAMATAWTWGRSRLLISTVLVVSTPTVVFLVSSVSTSGFELTTAICAWTAALIVSRDHPSDPPRGLLVVLAASLSVLGLTRPISTLWVALILITIVAIAWRRSDIRAIAARRDARVLVGVTVAAVVAATCWTMAVGGIVVLPAIPVPPSVPFTRVVSLSLSHLWTSLAQTTGTFGWNDTYEPEIAALVILFVMAIPAVLCIARSRVRDVALLAGLVGLSIAVPLLVMVVAARHDGVFGQGRDFMPLWVGVPLYAAATQDTLPTSITRRLSAVMTVGVGFGLVAGFWCSLHRSSVGIQGPYLPWNVPTGGWRPPVSATVLDLLEVIAAVALVVWVDHLAVTGLRDRRRNGPTDSDAVTAVTEGAERETAGRA